MENPQKSNLLHVKGINFKVSLLDFIQIQAKGEETKICETTTLVHIATAFLLLM